LLEQDFLAVQEVYTLGQHQHKLFSSPFLSVLAAIFQVDRGYSSTRNVSILDFIGAKDIEGGGGDNWSYKTSKAPV